MDYSRVPPPSSYPNETAHTEEAAGVEPDGFVTEPFMEVLGLPKEGFLVVPKSLKEHLIIEHTAQFIRKEGDGIEFRIKLNDEWTRRLPFLLADDPLHAYYEYLKSTGKMLYHLSPDSLPSNALSFYREVYGESDSDKVTTVPEVQSDEKRDPMTECVQQKSGESPVVLDVRCAEPPISEIPAAKNLSTSLPIRESSLDLLLSAYGEEEDERQVRADNASMYPEAGVAEGVRSTVESNLPMTVMKTEALGSLTLGAEAIKAKPLTDLSDKGEGYLFGSNGDTSIRGNHPSSDPIKTIQNEQQVSFVESRHAHTAPLTAPLNPKASAVQQVNLLSEYDGMEDFDGEHTADPLPALNETAPTTESTAAKSTKLMNIRLIAQSKTKSITPSDVNDYPTKFMPLLEGNRPLNVTMKASTTKPKESKMAKDAIESGIIFEKPTLNLKRKIEPLTISPICWKPPSAELQISEENSRIIQEIGHILLQSPAENTLQCESLCVEDSDFVFLHSDTMEFRYFKYMVHNIMQFMKTDSFAPPPDLTHPLHSTTEAFLQFLDKQVWLSARKKELLERLTESQRQQKLSSQATTANASKQLLYFDTPNSEKPTHSLHVDSSIDVPPTSTATESLTRHAMTPSETIKEERRKKARLILHALTKTS